MFILESLQSSFLRYYNVRRENIFRISDNDVHVHLCVNCHSLCVCMCMHVFMCEWVCICVFISVVHYLVTVKFCVL